MAKRDMITDLTDLTHPIPEEPKEFADEDEGTGWRAMADETAEEREAYEQRLRLTWDQQDDFDPLLDEIAAARYAMLQAEARMRLLIAYGREFTRPRPYRLEDLARASGMSISGVRTAYHEDEVAEVAKLTGTRPRRPAESP
jgi:hypothetical protein